MNRHFWTLSYLVLISQVVGVGGCASREADRPSPVERVDQQADDREKPMEAPPAVPEPEPQPAATESVPAEPKDSTSAASMPKPSAERGALPATEARKPLPQLREELLASTNPDATLQLIDLIGRRRGRAREALPDLVGLTTANDPRVRWHAARSIGLIGEDAIAEIPALLKLLQDADPVVATQAAAAIGHIREDDNRVELPVDDAELYRDAITQLVAALVHSDPRVRRACLQALRQLDPDPEQIMPVVDAVFAGNDPAFILPALHSVADMGAEGVPFLVERLKRPQGRYWASVALTEIGPAAAAATPALLEALADSPPEEQLQEILALAAIGEPARAAGDDLISLYAEGEPSLRGVVLYALGKLKVAKAEPLLTEVVATEAPQLAATAAWARAKIDPGNDELVDDALERLLTQCESEEEFARVAAISALSDLAAGLQQDARTALAGQFAAMLEDPSDRVHDNAAAALIRLDGDAVPSVTKLLADPVTELPAVKILAEIGSAAAGAVEPLSERLDAENEAVVGEAILALAAIGPPAGGAVDRLVPLLEESADEAAVDQGEGLRYAAAYCLGRIGAPAASPAVEKLAKLADSEDLMLSTVAIWAALQIEPENQKRFERAIPLLTAALEAESQTVRLEAAIALGDLGNRAETAVPALELVAEDDPIRSIRDAARQSLGKIRGN
jgi:HEAT repeat protein